MSGDDLSPYMPGGGRVTYRFVLHDRGTAAGVALLRLQSEDFSLLGPLFEFPVARLRPHFLRLPVPGDELRVEVNWLPGPAGADRLERITHVPQESADHMSHRLPRGVWAYDPG